MDATVLQVIMFVLLPMLTIVVGGIIGTVTELKPLVRSAVQRGPDLLGHQRALWRQGH